MQKLYKAGYLSNFPTVQKCLHVALAIAVPLLSTYGCGSDSLSKNSSGDISGNGSGNNSSGNTGSSSPADPEFSCTLAKIEGTGNYPLKQPMNDFSAASGTMLLRFATESRANISADFGAEKISEFSKPPFSLDGVDSGTQHLLVIGENQTNLTQLSVSSAPEEYSLQTHIDHVVYIASTEEGIEPTLLHKSASITIGATTYGILSLIPAKDDHNSSISLYYPSGLVFSDFITPGEVVKLGETPYSIRATLDGRKVKLETLQDSKVLDSWHFNDSEVLNLRLTADATDHNPRSLLFRVKMSEDKILVTAVEPNSIWIIQDAKVDTSATHIAPHLLWSNFGTSFRFVGLAIISSVASGQPQLNDSGDSISFEGSPLDSKFTVTKGDLEVGDHVEIIASGVHDTITYVLPENPNQLIAHSYYSLSADQQDFFSYTDADGTYTTNKLLFVPDGTAFLSRSDGLYWIVPPVEFNQSDQIAMDMGIQFSNVGFSPYVMTLGLGLDYDISILFDHSQRFKGATYRGDSKYMAHGYYSANGDHFVSSDDSSVTIDLAKEPVNQTISVSFEIQTCEIMK